MQNNLFGNEPDGWNDLIFSFGKAGLPVPPVPADLRTKLVKIGKWCWSTRADIPNPYSVDWFVVEAVDERPARYAVVAHSGHGGNSYAIHYFLVEPDLALFVQMPWGGICDNNERCIREMVETFRTCSTLQRKVAKRVLSGKQQGKQLIVVETPFYGSRWTWSTSDETPAVEMEIWYKAESALHEVLTLPESGEVVDPSSLFRRAPLMTDTIAPDALGPDPETTSTSTTPIEGRQTSPAAPNGILKMSFTFRDMELWADELNEAIYAFHVRFGVHPNLMSTGIEVYRAIDEAAAKQQDHILDEDGNPVDPDLGVDIGAFRTGECEVTFTLDETTAWPEFILIYDEDPSFDGEPEPIVDEGQVQVKRYRVA